MSCSAPLLWRLVLLLIVPATLGVDRAAPSLGRRAAPKKNGRSAPLLSKAAPLLERSAPGSEKAAPHSERSAPEFADAEVSTQHSASRSVVDAKKKADLEAQGETLLQELEAELGPFLDGPFPEAPEVEPCSDGSPLKTAIKAEVDSTKTAILNAGPSVASNEDTVARKIEQAVKSAATRAGASDEEAADLGSKEAAQLRNEVAKEVAQESLKTAAAENDLSKVELVKSEKQAALKAATVQNNQIKVQLAAVKQQAAAVAFEKDKAATQLKQASLAKKNLQEENETVVVDDKDAKRRFAAAEEAHEKAEIEDQAKELGKMAAADEARAQTAGLDVQQAALTAGKGEEEAKAIGFKARAAAEKQASVKVTELRKQYSEARAARHPVTGCSGWAPADGPMKSRGATCESWGASKRWCWVTSDYAGPGHEFIMASDSYSGKLFAPCAATGVFPSRYAATWASTGCPNMPPEATWSWYGAQKSAVVFDDMFKFCQSSDDKRRALCCGTGANKIEDCDPTCVRQVAWTEVDGEKPADVPGDSNVSSLANNATLLGSTQHRVGEVTGDSN